MRSRTGPSLAADVVCLSMRGGRLECLLIRRGRDPFRGAWAVPGGFVEEGEDAPAGALRELHEETGVEPGRICLLGFYSDPRRDPRRHIASVVYLAPLPPDAAEGVAGDDAASAAWHPIDASLELAFDHAVVLADAHREVRRRAEAEAFALRLAPAEFTLEGLAELHRSLLGRPFDARRLAETYRSAGLLAAARGGRLRVVEAALEAVETRGYVVPALG